MSLMVEASAFGKAQVFWSMVWFFLFFIWIWLLIVVFGDIFRSDDLGGSAKALWTIFIIRAGHSQSVGGRLRLVAELRSGRAVASTRVASAFRGRRSSRGGIDRRMALSSGASCSPLGWSLMFGPRARIRPTAPLARVEPGTRRDTGPD